MTPLLAREAVLRVHPTLGSLKYKKQKNKQKLKIKKGRGGRNDGGGGRREAGYGGFPTPARALGSIGGKYLPLGG